MLGEVVLVIVLSVIYVAIPELIIIVAQAAAKDLIYAVFVIS